MADIQLTPGSHVLVHDVEYVITHILSSSSFVGTRQDNGDQDVLRLVDVREMPEDFEPPDVDIHDATPEQIDEAKRILDAILPLMTMNKKKRRDVEAVAKAMDVNTATVYRWIEKFKQTMTLASLIKDKPDGGEGGIRVHKDVEKIIQNVIDEHYLTKQKKKDYEIVELIRDEVGRTNHRKPHRNTIINRLKKIPGRKKAEERGEVRELEKHTATPGKFKMAKFPLHIYQMDHTPLDVEIVDDEYRLPIGRPWLTLAIDVYSRMVAGILVSLDAPSALSVGLCLTHAIMPKENWLAERGITHAWPIYGKPGAVHADNAAEFRCEATTLGCQNNLIDIYWRRVKRPRYGAHIERLIGTVAKKLKALPGATFSNPQERGDYKSAEHAIFTLREVECWVAELLLGKYHNKRHGGLNTTPLACFEEGIHGTATKPGRGLPPRPTDSRRLLIDFLPFEKRTIQPDGVTWDNVSYYSRALQDWVGAKDEDGETRQFRFHRDPRGISPLFFYDPKSKRYIDVPYADLSHPVISLKELQAAQEFAAAKGKAAVNEDAIFRAAENMRRLEHQAAETTKSVRRERQKKKSRGETLKTYPTATPPSPQAQARVEPAPVETPKRSTVIVPYEVEEAS